MKLKTIDTENVTQEMCLKFEYHASAGSTQDGVTAALEAAPAINFREIELGKSPDGKLYAERDWEKQGDYFMRHMMAGTAENLRRKTDIAAELAHRDILIDALRQMLSHAEHIAQERSRAIVVLKTEIDVLREEVQSLEADNANCPTCGATAE